MPRPAKLAALFCLALAPAAFAENWKPQLFPDGYDIWAKGGLLVREGEAPAKGVMPKEPKYVFDKDNKLTPIGQYLDDLARDPQKIVTHLRFALSKESGLWIPIDNAKFKGLAMNMPGQSCIHRTLGTVGAYRRMITTSKSVPLEFKKGIADMDNKEGKYFPPPAEWKATVEKLLRESINDDGFFGTKETSCDLAQSFHMIRTAIGGAGLDVRNIYTIDKAQLLVRSILTLPSYYQGTDEWVPITNEDKEKYGNTSSDTMPDDGPWFKDGKRLFPAGQFTGWKNAQHPSMHGTWDGLAIINQLYKHYPVADATSDKSIFYLWNKLPPEQKKIAQDGMTTLKRRIWLDYKENQGPSNCFIVKGVPIDDKTFKELPAGTKPDVPLLNDCSGYDLAMRIHWGYLAYMEFFGPVAAPPSEKDGPTMNAGLAALFATWEKAAK